MAVAPFIPIIAAAGKSAATAAVTGAAISGGAGLASSALRSRSEGRATNAQLKANEAAIQYEREREAARKVAYDQMMAQRQQAFDAWYGRVGDEGIKRYGVPTGLTIPGTIGGSAGQTATKIGGAVPLGGGAVPMSPKPPTTLGSLMGGAPIQNAPSGASLSTLMGQIPNASAAPVATEPLAGSQTLADIGGWGDWRRYGVGR